MASNAVINEMMEIYANTVERSFNGCLNVSEEIQELAASMLPCMMGFNEKQGKMVFDPWAKAVDGIFTTLKSFNAKLFNEINLDRIFKKSIGEFWGHIGITSIEETGRLCDQLELLKTQMAEYQKRDRNSELTKHLEKSGKFVVKDDIKPFEHAFNTLNDLKDNVSDVEKLRMTVTQLEQDLSKYMDEIEQLKQLVAQINPKISTLTVAIEKLSGSSDKAQAGNAE